uniref:GLOBIN domain-containing protein n=1 Tax=Angiostrongylus cantonensis TaxID=6313 RepID=A0A158P6L2_ANGCA
LTHDQRAMIRSSYTCMERESTRNGLGLFVRLFSEYPQYKNIWPQFREIPDSALISSDKLRNHGIVYMAGLKQVVAVLDDDDKLIEVAKRIARSHCKWNICKSHIEVGLTKSANNLLADPLWFPRIARSAWAKSALNLHHHRQSQSLWIRGRFATKRFYYQNGDGSWYWHWEIKSRQEGNITRSRQ